MSTGLTVSPGYLDSRRWDSEQVPDSRGRSRTLPTKRRPAAGIARLLVFLGAMLFADIAFGQTESRVEEFVLELAGPATPRISKVVLYNAGEDGRKLYSKDFQVLAATGDNDEASFRAIASGTLEPWTGPQTFEFDALPARFVKLKILSGYTSEFRELAEVEVYSADGNNVAAAGNGGTLLSYSSAYTEQGNVAEGDWSASNINDSVLSGAGSTWRSQGHRYYPYPPSEFLLEVSDQSARQVGKVVFYNEGHGGPTVQDLYSKDFEVLVSATGRNDDAFSEIVAGTLEPRSGPQAFEFDPRPARFVKLRILTSYNRGYRELGEFEVHSTDGENVVAADRGGKLVSYTNAYTAEGDWSASNINDSVLSGPDGTWSSLAWGRGPGGAAILERKDTRPEINYPTKRSYGGFFGVDADGVMHESGIATAGSPFLFNNDTVAVYDPYRGLDGFYVIKDGLRGLQPIAMDLGLVTTYGGTTEVFQWPYSKVDFAAGLLNIEKIAVNAPLRVEVQYLIPEQWSQAVVVTVFNDGDGEVHGNLQAHLAVGIGPAAATARATDMTRVAYDRDFGGLVGTSNGHIGEWHFAFGADGGPVRHLATTDDKRPSQLPGTGAAPSAALETGVPVHLALAMPVQIASGASQQFRFAFGFDDRSRAGAERRASRARAADAAKVSAAMRGYWQDKGSRLVTGNTLTNAMHLYALGAVFGNWERGGKYNGDFGGWGPIGLYDFPAHRYRSGLYSTGHLMMSNTVDVTLSAAETEQVLRFITGSENTGNWEDALYDWWPRADPHIQKLVDYRAAHDGKIFLPELESWERFDPFVYYPVVADRFYSATGNRKFLAWYYDYMKNSLLFLRDNFTNEDGMLLMGGSNFDTWGAAGGRLTDGSPFAVLGRIQMPAFGSVSAMARLARELDKPDDVAMWLEWRGKLKKGIDEQLWRHDHYQLVARDPSPLVHEGTLDTYADTWAAIFGVADRDRLKLMSENTFYTGQGFPTSHPPRYHGTQSGSGLFDWHITGDTYSYRNLDGHTAYYANYHNGAQVTDTLGRLAAMAALAGNERVMEQTFDSYEQMVSKLKSFPFVMDPWTTREMYYRGGHEGESAMAIVQMLTQGQAGLRYAGANVAFRPLMTARSGGSVAIRDLLWGTSRFDIDVAGLGIGLARLRIDGTDVPSEIVPATYHDGKRHRLEMIPGPADGPQLRDLGLGVHRLDDVTLTGNKLAFGFAGYSGEPTTLALNTAGRAIRSASLNGRAITFTVADDIASTSVRLDREQNSVEVMFE